MTSPAFFSISRFIISLRKMNFSRATRDNHQEEEKLGQKDNQRSGTGLSQTRQRFFFLIFVVEDIFLQTIFSHQTLTIYYSILIFGKEWTHFERFNYLDNDKTFQKTKITSLKAALSKCKTILLCVPHIEFWVPFCLNEQPEQIHVSSTAFRSKSL